MSDPAPGHPVRYLTDGTATTRRVRGVREVRAGEDAWRDGVRRFAVATSWAGSTVPYEHIGHVADLHPDGTVTIDDRLADRQPPQFLAGIRRRVRTAAALTPRTTDQKETTP